MRTERLWLATVMLTLVVGCGTKAPPDEPGGSHKGLAARLKAETTVTTTSTSTAIATGTLTSTGTGTLTVTIYYISPVTYSRTVTSTVFKNDGGNITGTASNTTTGTYIDGTSTVTGTMTATGTVGAWVNGTGTRTLTVWANQTTASLTVLRTDTATGTATGMITYTGTQTETATVTDTQTNSSTEADASTETDAPPTTDTSTSTETSGGTITQVVTETITQTSTAPGTATGSQTVTRTATATATLTGTATGTHTATIYYISPLPYTRTATSNSYANGGSNITGTKSGTATVTYTSGSLTMTGTTTATGTIGGWVPGTGTSTLTVSANQTTASKTVLRTATGSGTGTGSITYSETQVGTVTVIDTVTTTMTQTAIATVPDPCAGPWAFCDNLESGNVSKWTVKQGSSEDFSVVLDGSKVLRQSNSTAGTWHLAQAGKLWLDQTVEGKLKVTAFSSATGGSFAALFGRYESTPTGDCAYYLQVRGDGNVALGKRLNGVDSTLGNAVASGIVAGTWHTLKLEIAGSTISALVDGTVLLTQVDATCEAGAVGVGSLGASFEVDDVRVAAPATNSCVAAWAGSQWDICTGQTQEDRKQCYRFLNCYAQNGCSPETCGGDDDFCGVHQAGNPANPADPQWPRLNAWGMAPKVIADHVYKRMGCPGSVRCDSPAKPNWASCADGNACTTYDHCQDGVCVGEGPVPCNASDQCHDAGECNPDTGICSNPAKEDGTACDDASLCTPTDICQDGACVGQDPVVCAGSDQCHGVCVPTTGECTNDSKPDDTPCDDGSACTRKDVCYQGACEGKEPVTCTAQDECHGVGTCDETTGECSNPTIDKIGCNISLTPSRIADMGDGNYIAIFGWNHQGTTNYHPAQNEVRLDGVLQTNPQPPPPYALYAGFRPGGYLPTFSAGQTISWTVDGATVTADENSTTLTPVSIGTGTGVVIDGETLMLKPDLSPFKTIPEDPGKSEQDPPGTTGSAFRGILTGQLAIGSSGQATYTLPIDIPPGIAGMAPNLNLVYSSQGSNGIAGQGWALTGLSMVHRCAKTIKQDGFPQPLYLTDGLEGDPEHPAFGDAVCLDGARLFYRWATNSYEPESKDFSTITRNGDTFVVKTKSGETREYGRTFKGRIHFLSEVGPVFPGPPNTVITGVWLLERVTDPWGNYYEIHYDYEDGSSYGVRPLVTEINYTGHNALGPNDTSFPTFSSVKFTYESRTDVRNTRFASSYVALTKRLKTISTDRGTYTLTYLPNNLSQPSRLQQIDYCSRTDTTACTEPLTFDWNVPLVETPTPQWEERPIYKLPVTQVGPGTQFVDLDGDGRLDFVLAMDLYRPWEPPLAYRSYRNNGYGQKCNGSTCTPSDEDSAAWIERPEWKLPWGLADGDQNYYGVLFADFDADGKPDLIADKGINGKPTVWLNHLTKDGGSWDVATGGLGSDSLQAVLSSFPDEQHFGRWTGMDFTIGRSENGVRVADVNGDGRADLVNLQRLDDGRLFRVRVVRSTESGWVRDQNYEVTSLIGNYRPGGVWLADMNRDGLPDIAGADNAVNTGSGWSFWGGYSDDDPSGYVVQDGDFDGDGLHDRVYQSASACSREGLYGPVHCGGLGAASIGFSNGYRRGGRAADGFEEALGRQTDPASYDTYRDLLSAGQFRLADLNADGLADIVVNHTKYLRPLINTGSTFLDPDNYGTYATAEAKQDADSNWIHPLYAPGQIDWLGPLDGWTTSFDAFFDVDGDGVADHISTETGVGGTVKRGAWLNKFQPPVIEGFPNGLAQKSKVAYEVITTSYAVSSGVYTDTGTTVSDGPFATRRLNAPLRVVTGLGVGNGVNTTLNWTNYKYYDLRMSVKDRDPQGFAKVVATDQETHIATETSFYQHYPFTGRPSKVERYYVDPSTGAKSPLTSTTTKYKTDNTYYNSDPPTGSAPAAATSLFVGIDEVRDVAFQQPDKPVEFIPSSPKVPALTTVTSTEYDAAGNAKYVSARVITKDASQTYIDAYLKEITNTFGGAGSKYETRGKVTKAVVKTTQILSSYGLKPVSPPITHETDFEYEDTDAMPLVKKVVEPGSNAPTKVQTAYAYDALGNLTTTTVCGGDFGNCKAGAAGPSSQPYRTTITSYEPKDFNPAPRGMTCRVTALPYGYGRFPVRTTLVGDSSRGVPDQVTYSAYDALFGAVIQSTDANGVQAYTVLDALGRPTQHIGRCGFKKDGVLRELVTSVSRVVPSGPTNWLTKLITRTEQPDHSVTWVASDALGRTVGTFARHFSGGYTSAEIKYDNRGQVWKTSKPTYKTEPLWTENLYDWLGRAQKTTEELGSLDGLGLGEIRGKAVKTWSYEGDGFTVHSWTRVQGEDRHRWEGKNGMGKVAWVKDAKGKVMNFDYDVDGNLSKVTDTQGHEVITHYDVRGRKSLMTDPDLGTWTYGYNSYGDLLTQTDGAGNVTTMTYDVFGRMLTKTAGAATSEWVYDKAPGAGIGRLATSLGPEHPLQAGKCVMPHTTATGLGRSGRTYTYDAFGAVQQASECIDGETFVTDFSYDDLGRQVVTSYPAVQGERFAVGYHYTKAGFLYAVTDHSDESLLWTVEKEDAYGNPEAEYTGNGVRTVKSLNRATGWSLYSISTSQAQNDATLQAIFNTFDEAGNLRARLREDPIRMGDSSEQFSYDLLDRVKSSHVQVKSEDYDHTEAFDYDDIGNLILKGDKTYSYVGCAAGGGAHTVCSVNAGAPYSYDKAGNMLNGNGHKVTYTRFNKVSHIENTAASIDGTTAAIDFGYGADGDRVFQAVGTTAGIGTSRTLYIGMGGTGKSIYERTSTDNSFEHVHFIYAGGAHGGNAFAMLVKKESQIESGTPTSSVQYHLFDHLGSITGTTDEEGNVQGPSAGANTSVFGYDPWGMRRRPDGRPAGGTLNVQVGHREFTGHETIPHVTLINMNGRVYDPQLGRFLSADPTIQFATNLQSYNRYSYVLNNPLSFTDPSGFGRVHQPSVAKQLGMFGLVVAVEVAAIAVCAYTDGAGCAPAQATAAAIIAATAARASGESWAQTAEAGGLAFAKGYFLSVGGGALSNGISGMVGAGPAAGAISGVAINILSTEASGGRFWWGNILMAAAQGAAAGAAAAENGENPLSEAGKARLQKADWASGEDADKGGGTSVKGAGSVMLVRDKDGNVVGKIAVVKYEATSRGLAIKLKYVNQSSSLTDWDWVQSITTNSPLGGATSPYNDPQPPDDGLPFYWTKAERAGMSTPNSVSFSDAPSRTPNGSVINWSAELSLVGQTGTAGHYEIMRTITYGFSMDGAGNVTLNGMKIVAPSTFQKSSVP